MSNVCLRTADRPWKGVARVTWSIVEFYISLNLSGMAEDRIVKFCARVGPRSISLAMRNCPQVGVVKVTWRLQFLANDLENGVRQRYTYHGRLIGNRIWPIKWQQRQWPWMTLKVIHRLQIFFKCNLSHICAIFYTISTDSVLAVGYSYAIHCERGDDSRPITEPCDIIII